MKIQKRILVSNTLMVLLSLLCLFIVGGTLVNFFKTKYERQEENNGLRNSYINQIDQLIDENSKQYNKWDELEDQLSNYGYKLYVSNDGKMVYSNLSHKSKEVSSYANQLSVSNKIQLYSNGFVSVISKKVIKENKEYKIYAVYITDKEVEWFGKNRNIYEIFLLTFISISITSILIILLISLIFSKKLVKKILKPVNKLINSAQRIENGNLSTFIDYKGYDEFELLCKSFNEMQKHLKEEKEKNLAYEKARTDMIAGLSHDLRTPLTSIKGYVKGIIDGIANTEEKKKLYLSTAYKKACDMETLVDTLFFFSKLETGNLPFFFIKVDLSEFIQKFVSQAKEDAKMKDIELDIKIHNNCIVCIDVEQIKRVFNNIIDNSIKYSKVKNLKISIEAKKENEKAIISFKDNGIGISNEKLKNVFEQFYREDESRSAKNGEGNGLGLYIVKSIIESHNGIVEAKSDDGFELIMTLPIKKGEEDGENTNS